MNADAYQARIGGWHLLAWPEADRILIALKLAEECGEVAAAVGKPLSDSAFVAECADVLNVLAALTYRHGYTLSQIMTAGLERVGA